MGKILVNLRQDGQENPARKNKAEILARATDHSIERTSFLHPQSYVSNTALQRHLAQRATNAPFDLDDATADRIHRARSSGQALDGAVQAQMSRAMGHDFSGVRVHTDDEAHALNERLNAKAFTTGPDIFFRSGAYSPQSSAGQQLIAHELTHVVQQASGAVESGGAGMRVNAPGDRFEQEADAVARQVSSAAPAVQRQTPEEDELQTSSLQRQELEDEALQMQRVQRQEEEEEPVQMQELDEEEAVQMQTMPEEEEAAAL